MNKHKIKSNPLYIFLFIIFEGLFMISTLNQVVFAATDVNPTNSVIDAGNEQNYKDALAKTPKGLHWSDKDFIKANFEDNSAEIVNSTNPATLNTSVIKMTNTNYQVGGIWSNLSEDNFFNINENQTASMWLYFGSYKNSNYPDSLFPGDGMAFVMHNDPRGTNAHSIGKDKDGTIEPGNGETLGVWGTDWDWNETNPANIAKNAVQNSLAIEFDTFVNKLTTYKDVSGEGVSFDAQGINGQHIAIGYPGNPSDGTFPINTYFHNSIKKPAGDTSGGPATKNYFTMLHLAATDGLNLVDNNWHHLTIQWTKPAANSNLGTITYKYDDKNTDGTPTNSAKISSTVIDTNQFKSTDGKLYWGFTGSTGKYTENNLLVFESLPSFVDAQATADIHNDTENTEVKDGGHVNANDDITYNYNLKYIGWTREWTNIKTRMQIPENMTFTSGEITYANGEKETIPSSVFSDTTDPNHLNYQLLQTLNKDNRTATVSLHGKAAKTTTNTLTVPSAHAHFDGDNLITDTDAPSFVIDPKSITLESSTPYIIRIKKGEDAQIKAHVNYLGTNATPDLTKLTVYQKIGDQDYTAQKGIVDSAGDFTLNIPNSQLNDSSTPVSFYVKDDSGNLGQTNTLERTIQFGGTVYFGEVSSNVKFKNINFGNKNKLVPRIDDWNVHVIDSREKGASWTVQAKASQLTNLTTDKPFDGSLVFRPTPDSQPQTLSNATNIAQYTKPDDQIETNNITLSWTDQSGILLALNNNASPAGQYNGVIYWTLLDSLANK